MWLTLARFGLRRRNLRKDIDPVGVSRRSRQLHENTSRSCVANSVQGTCLMVRPMTARPMQRALLSGRGRLANMVLLGGVLPAIIFSVEPARGAVRWFRVSESEWFSGWRAQLQELVDQSPNQAPSRICIVGLRDVDPATLQAYVIWPAQHRLITWIPSKDDDHSLVHETHVLDLNKDIVATRREIGSSTYLEDRAWLLSTERHCKRSGTTLKLAPAERH